MKLQKLLLVTGLCALLGSGSVSALEVSIDGEACPVTVYSGVDGADERQIEVSALTIYGRIGDYLVLKGEDGLWFADAAALAEALPDIPYEALPDGSSLEEVSAGNTGARAEEIQAQLIRLGLLEGTADGQYGQGTAAAVSAFQEQSGLAVTGNADAATQMALQQAAAGGADQVTVSYPAVNYTSPEEKFAQIINNVEDDLSIYMDSKWHFSYDPFAALGWINPNVELGTLVVDTPDIDRIRLDASLQVVVSRDEESGLIGVYPSVVVISQGAFRPYLETVYLGNEGEVVQLTGAVSTGSMDGITMREQGYVPLSEEAIPLLLNGEIDQIRVEGKNQFWDLSVTAEAQQVRWFEQVLQGEE